MLSKSNCVESKVPLGPSSYWTLHLLLDFIIIITIMFIMFIILFILFIMFIIVVVTTCILINIFICC